MAIEFLNTTEIYQMGQLPDPVTLCEFYQDDFNVTTVRIHRLRDIGGTIMKAADGSMARGLAAMGEVYPEVLGSEPLMLRNDLWLPPANRQMYGFSLTTQAESSEPLVAMEDLYDHDHGLGAYLTPDTTNTARFLRPGLSLRTSAVAARGITEGVDDTLLRGHNRIAVLPDNPSLAGTVDSLREVIGEYGALQAYVRDPIVDFLVESTAGYPLERETVSLHNYRI